jgi:hypothetical protein
MKHILCLTVFLIFANLHSFSQDSTIIINKGRLLKYRWGYLITSKDDTVYGLIYHESDSKIYFIKKGSKIKVSLTKEPTTIPCIFAYDGTVKAFFRNKLFYVVRSIPPLENPVFLTVLVSGSMSLYCSLTDYQDANTEEATFGFLMFGLAGGIVSELIGSLESVANNNKFKEEEYYSVKDYFIQKKTANQLFLIPNGEKKFRNAFIPLIRDNKKFIDNLVGQPVDYYHLRYLVQLYNEVSAGGNN